MRDNSDEKNMVLIQGGRQVSTEKSVVSQKVTSPIRKMLLDFSKEKAKDKFRIMDLFGKD